MECDEMFVPRRVRSHYLLYYLVCYNDSKYCKYIVVSRQTVSEHCTVQYCVQCAAYSFQTGSDHKLQSDGGRARSV